MPSVVWINIFPYTWRSLCWRQGKSLCQWIKFILLLRNWTLVSYIKYLNRMRNLNALIFVSCFAHCSCHIYGSLLFERQVSTTGEMIVASYCLFMFTITQKHAYPPSRLSIWSLRAKGSGWAKIHPRHPHLPKADTLYLAGYRCHIICFFMRPVWLNIY